MLSLESTQNQLELAATEAISSEVRTSLNPTDKKGKRNAMDSLQQGGQSVTWCVNGARALSAKIAKYALLARARTYHCSPANGDGIPASVCRHACKTPFKVYDAATLAVRL